MQVWEVGGLRIWQHVLFVVAIGAVVAGGVMVAQSGSGPTDVLIVAGLFSFAVFAYVHSLWRRPYLLATEDGIVNAGGLLTFRRAFYRWETFWVRDPDKHFEAPLWEDVSEAGPMWAKIAAILYGEVWKSYRAVIYLRPLSIGAPSVQTVRLHATERLGRKERAAAMREIHRRWRETAAKVAEGPQDVVGT
jgi:hypothetical protein